MVTETMSARTAQLTTQELVEEAKAFSHDAWTRIFDEQYTRILRYCFLRTGDRTAAEDLTSDVFLEALRGIHRYRYRGVPLAAWLYRIAHNLTVDHLKRRATRPSVSLDAGDGARLIPQVDDRADEAVLRHDVHDALRQLTKEQQQVLVLRFYQRLSHEEIAEVMQRRAGAVRALQHRALKALGRLLTPDGR